MKKDNARRNRYMQKVVAAQKRYKVLISLGYSEKYTRLTIQKEFGNIAESTYYRWLSEPVFGHKQKAS